MFKVEILEFCLYAHASRTEITKQFHDHLVEGFFEHKQYVEDKFGQTVRFFLQFLKFFSDFAAPSAICNGLSCTTSEFSLGVFN